METVLELARRDTVLSRASVKEWSGPCPKCKSTDSFSVLVSDYDGRGSWKCRYCWNPSDMLPSGRMRGFGDGIAYLRHFYGMSFQAARTRWYGGEEAPEERQPWVAAGTPRFHSPSWQSEVQQLADEAEQRLWSGEGKPALDYLLARGFRETTIRVAHLGYTHWTNKKWPTPVPCITIPWYACQRYWCLNFRDIRRSSPPEEPKYQNYPHSSGKGMYCADVLSYAKNRPVFLVEGEFDALSLAQEAGDLALVVATGSTERGRSPRWEAALALAPSVFIAFDREEKGNKGASYWSRLLPNARRWLPLAHDVNDMLRYGASIRSWVQAALVYHRPSPSLQERADAQAFLKRLEEQECYVYYDQEGRQHIGVPQEWTDAQYCKIALEAERYDQVLRSFSLSHPGASPEERITC